MIEPSVLYWLALIMALACCGALGFIMAVAWDERKKK